MPIRCGFSAAASVRFRLCSETFFARNSAPVRNGLLAMPSRGIGRMVNSNTLCRRFSTEAAACSRLAEGHVNDCDGDGLGRNPANGVAVHQRSVPSSAWCLSRLYSLPYRIHKNRVLEERPDYWLFGDTEKIPPDKGDKSNLPGDTSRVKVFKRIDAGPPIGQSLCEVHHQEWYADHPPFLA